ncbi:putative proton-dependent oligopeptide transporter family [Helianthus annuus]|nr:hypothetical protein HanHA300_Chr07g0256711 [Helianthus annuus]KAJ0564359.1 hypothetical protein HanHA89_Chr07g0273471 [Helianthus annuus]KAJ0732425.1 hypothetical protein HanOQP8_Chr07g0263091 [Helianthus annuus]KAJ0909332.1 putative proton-dependent oligopeptide transporter family [Helianthus annuus]
MALEVVQNDNGEGAKWVCDSSLDHKGRLPLRSFTGTWKASFFIIGEQFFHMIIFMH